MDTVIYVDEHRISRSDCMDARAHFAVRIWHKGLFPTLRKKCQEMTQLQNIAYQWHQGEELTNSGGQHIGVQICQNCFVSLLNHEGSTLNEKKFATMGANSFVLSVNPILEGSRYA